MTWYATFGLYMLLDAVRYFIGSSENIRERTRSEVDLDVRGQVSFARLRRLHMKRHYGRQLWQCRSQPMTTLFKILPTVVRWFFAGQRQSQLSVFPKNRPTLRACITDICSYRSYICTAMRPGHSWYRFMGTSHSEQWQRLYQQKSHNFLEANCYSASGMAGLTTLELSFSNNLWEKTTLQNIFRILYGRFSPVFVM